MTALIYLIGTALVWGPVGLLSEPDRDRARARGAFVGSALGGLAGWAAFGTIGAMAFCGVAASALVLALSFRPQHARPTPLPIRHTQPAVMREAS